MKTISFKIKILLLVVVPIILLSSLLTLLAIYQYKQIGIENIKSFSDAMIDSRRAELKNYTEIAESAIKHIYEDSKLSEQQSYEQAKTILRNLSYGKDGYFFVTDYDGVTLVNRVRPSIEGTNSWDLQDPQGVYLVRELLSKAQEGGGYTEYRWFKKSKDREVDKISYSNNLDRWQWVFGTGLYVDDIEDTVQRLEKKIAFSISRTWKMFGLLALISTIILTFLCVRLTMSEGNLADYKLKELSKKVVVGQEEERSRVARDLQKDINKALYAIRVKLKEVARVSSFSTKESRQNFSTAIFILNKTIKEVYRISGELRPEALDNLGLYSAVEELVNKVSKENNIRFNFKKPDSVNRLHNELETAIYRVVQEAINNIVAHSNASSISVRIQQAATLLNVTIQDNGVGFNMKTLFGKGGKSSVGFTDMRVRAESLGGTFSVFSSEEIGTVIKVSVPL